MGSYYFSDFVLFHKTFGITAMVSIERDTDNAARFEFNRPFDCIAMGWGSTTNVLPTLPIFNERPVICWLDYYDRLSDSILGDVSVVLNRAQVGSALIVTLKGSAFNKASDIDDFMKNLPVEVRTPKNRASLASPKGVRDFMLSVLEMRIESVLSDLNQASKQPITAKKIFNISYKDGVAMVSYGWLLLDDARLKKLENEPCAFDSPGLCVGNDEHIEINTPPLTFREIAHLKSILPNGRGAADFEKKAKPLKEEDAQQFAKFYRYYPNFADIEE